MTLKHSQRRSTKSSGTSGRNNRVGIVGHSRIGKAVAAFFPDALIYDADQGLFWLEKETFGYLHFCNVAPVRYIAEFIERHGAGALVFIHNEAPPGVTHALQKLTGNQFIVHSPLRGVADKLVDSMASFTQYIGADSPGAARLAVEHLQAAGIKCEAVYNSMSTETSPRPDTIIDLDQNHEA